MNLTEDQVQEIKVFIEENLNQKIDARLVNCMTHNEVLSKFFYFNLEPYLAPDTSDTVRQFILSLKEPVIFKRFKFLPFLFGCFIFLV